MIQKNQPDKTESRQARKKRVEKMKNGQSRIHATLATLAARANRKAQRAAAAIVAAQEAALLARNYAVANESEYCTAHTIYSVDMAFNAADRALGSVLHFSDLTAAAFVACVK